MELLDFKSKNLYNTVRGDKKATFKRKIMRVLFNKIKAGAMNNVRRWRQPCKIIQITSIVSNLVRNFDSEKSHISIMLR